LNAVYLERVERRVMAAIEACRMAALSGHLERCDDCGLTRIAYGPAGTKSPPPYTKITIAVDNRSDMN
jgi:hypothetical protein